jgi:hypothetical protein
MGDGRQWTQVRPYGAKSGRLGSKEIGGALAGMGVDLRMPQEKSGNVEDC